jgi:hypothetical protein
VEKEAAAAAPPEPAAEAAAEAPASDDKPAESAAAARRAEEVEREAEKEVKREAEREAEENANQDAKYADADFCNPKVIFLCRAEMLAGASEYVSVFAPTEAVNPRKDELHEAVAYLVEKRHVAVA